MKKHLSDKDKLEVVKLYLSGTSIKDLSVKYGIELHMVEWVMSRKER